VSAVIVLTVQEIPVISLVCFVHGAVAWLCRGYNQPVGDITPGACMLIYVAVIER